MDAVLGVVIDPSGAQSGGKVVKRTLDDIRGSASEASKAVSGGLNNSLKSAIGYIKGMAAAYVSLRAARSIMDQVIAATIEQEAVERQLGAALKSTGHAAGVSASQIKSMASEMQGLTNYGDEAVIAMNNILLTFKEIKGKEFKAANMAVLDMATALGMDLQGAAIMVGKALNAPVTGITAMQRAGIQFTESQKNVIKSLVETGQVAKAQQMILAELSSQFGGSAIAARDTLGGALQSLKNTWGDLFEMGDLESFGKLRGAIEELNTALRSDAIARFKTSIGDLIASSLTRLMNILEFVAKNVNVLILAMKTLIRIAIMRWITSAVVALGTFKEGVTTATVALKGLSFALSPMGAIGLAASAGMFLALALDMKETERQAKVTADAIKEVNDAFGNADASVLRSELAKVEDSLRGMRLEAQAAKDDIASVITSNPSLGMLYGMDPSLDQAIKDMSVPKGLSRDIEKQEAKRKALADKLAGIGKVKPTAYGAGGKEGKAGGGGGKSAGGGGKSAAESQVDAIRTQIKYLNADGTAFLPVLDQWKAKLKPLSDDWQKIVDLQNEIKADVFNKRIERMRDMMEFDNKSGAEFVGRLDEMQKGFAKLSPEWKQIESFKKSIADETWSKTMQGFDDQMKEAGTDLVKLLADVTKMRDETQKIGADGLITQQFKDIDEKVKSITETLSSRASWDFAQGFITADQYAGLLRDKMSGLSQDSEEYRKVFADLQSVTATNANKMIDSLTKQFESGKLGSAGYEEALVGIMERFQEFPLVVQTAMDSLQRFREAEELTIVSTGQQLSTALRDVTKDFHELQGKAILGVVDGFLNAAVAGGDFGESLKKLGQDIVFTVLKMIVMQQIMKMFGVAGGGSTGGASIANAYNPMSSGFSLNATGGAFDNGMKLTKYAKGGVPSMPTFFPMNKGVGVMNEGLKQEAIMPLQRLPNGDLGVQAMGGDSGNRAPIITVNVQNNTGQQVGAEQTNVNYNNKTNEVVIGIVVDNISRGGAIAKSVRGLGR